MDGRTAGSDRPYRGERRMIEGMMGSGEGEGVSAGEPLAEAFALQVEAARVGFDWDEISGPLAKLREELSEVEEAIGTDDAEAVTAEVGDLLFSVVNLARLAEVDPAVALAAANRKFARRFAGVRRLAQERGVPMPGAPLADLDLLWDEVKAAEQ
jgi:uncharacterized protein YabN with tetrapyrrole methylase and pyrophosphatase domain